MKKLYYAAMYEITDSIMWLTISGDSERWCRWWNISEGFRRKRDNA